MTDFETMPEYQSIIEDMNFRIEAALREYIQFTRMNADNPQAIRDAETKCMEKQMEISLECRRRLAALESAYESE